jgi:hypothetical protein
MRINRRNISHRYWNRLLKRMNLGVNRGLLPKGRSVGKKMIVHCGQKEAETNASQAPLKPTAHKESVGCGKLRISPSGDLRTQRRAWFPAIMGI